MLMYTNSGKWIDVANPENISPEDICIEDLAKISRLARYGGLTNTFYSVGAHSLIMEHVLLNMCSSAGYADGKCEGQLLSAKIALIHDVTEVYYADMPYPVKQLFPEYENLELRAFDVICKNKFGIYCPNPISRIKPLDKCMWELEKPVLQDGRNFHVIYKEWFNGALKNALKEISKITELSLNNNNDFTMRKNEEFIKRLLCGGTEIIPEVEALLVSKMIKYS